eukprot:355524-Chlamydomonas_euryale.AAC.14
MVGSELSSSLPEFTPRQRSVIVTCQKQGQALLCLQEHAHLYRPLGKLKHMCRKSAISVAQFPGSGRFFPLQHISARVPQEKACAVHEANFTIDAPVLCKHINRYPSLCMSSVVL